MKSHDANPSSWLHPILRSRIVRRRRLLGRKILESRRREDRWTIVFVGALLHFHLREEHRGRHGGDGDAAAFRAADSVEHMLHVTRSEYASQRGKWRAYDVDTADKFVRAAVGVDLVHDYRKHLE